jgi:hypothetical protein
MGRALSRAPEAPRCRAQWLGPARAGPDMRRLIPTLLRQSRATCRRRRPNRHARTRVRMSGSAAARALHSPPGCIAHRHYPAGHRRKSTQNSHSDSHRAHGARRGPSIARRTARPAQPTRFRDCTRRAATRASLSGQPDPRAQEWGVAPDLLRARPGGARGPGGAPRRRGLGGARPRGSPARARPGPSRSGRRGLRVSRSVAARAGFSWSRRRASAIMAAGVGHGAPRRAARGWFR